MLNNCTNLTKLTLNLSQNDLSFEGVKHIATALKFFQLSSLSLDISRNNIENAGISILVKSIDTKRLT